MRKNGQFFAAVAKLAASLSGSMVFPHTHKNKQNGDPLIKALLHSTTSDQKLNSATFNTILLLPCFPESVVTLSPTQCETNQNPSVHTQQQILTDECGFKTVDKHADLQKCR